MNIADIFVKNKKYKIVTSDKVKDELAEELEDYLTKIILDFDPTNILSSIYKFNNGQINSLINISHEFEEFLVLSNFDKKIKLVENGVIKLDEINAEKNQILNLYLFKKGVDFLKNKLKNFLFIGPEMYFTNSQGYDVSYTTPEGKKLKFSLKNSYALVMEGNPNQEITKKFADLEEYLQIEYYIIEGANLFEIYNLEDEVKKLNSKFAVEQFEKKNGVVINLIY